MKVVTLKGYILKTDGYKLSFDTYRNAYFLVKLIM